MLGMIRCFGGRMCARQDEERPERRDPQHRPRHEIDADPKRARLVHDAVARESSRQSGTRETVVILTVAPRRHEQRDDDGQRAAQRREVRGRAERRRATGS